MTSTRQNRIELEAKRPAQQDVENEIYDAIQLLTNQANFIDVPHPVGCCGNDVGAHEQIAMFRETEGRYEDAESDDDAHKHYGHVERFVGPVTIRNAHFLPQSPLIE